MYVCIIVFLSSTCNALRKFSCILVFGDSKVDSGNNNYLSTIVKANHLPYGRDFPGYVPTGRFSNGRLVPDFLASYLNITNTVPPYLDPYLSNEQLPAGVSFASGGSVSKSIINQRAVGAVVPGAALAKQVGIICVNLKDLYDLGCRNFGISGLPPIGCIPMQITLKFEMGRKCVENENLDAELYNRKLAERLHQIQRMLPGSRVVYANLYEPLIDIINQPEKYGELCIYTP
ncbi:hypothetical protein RIF29_17205 [Crotalaria pallida]|uniref:GDSL esterase/lipase n=1 Tax=Crotalaria pallida TaxID=3830 RepID=A0AAN9FNN4_CROPI